MQKNSAIDLSNNRLGYAFRDESLLDIALTHRSFGSPNNERLEFLGDSILNFVVAEQLFHAFPQASEGDLSRLRASLVKGDTLAEIALTLELGSFLYLGEGELRSGGSTRTSILADAFEAIIGAIYLDAGIAPAKAFILRLLAKRFQDLSLTSGEKDPKTQLQEWLQGKKYDLPQYSVVAIRGEAHSQEFVVSCTISLFPDSTFATAANRKNAEKEAALLMLAKIEKEYGN